MLSVTGFSRQRVIGFSADGARITSVNVFRLTMIFCVFVFTETVLFRGFS